MKSKTEYLIFNTSARRAFINITPQVANIVAESDIKEGFCLVNAMHISASVFINDDESGLHQDFDRWLEKLVPYSPESYILGRGSKYSMASLMASDKTEC